MLVKELKSLLKSSHSSSESFVYENLLVLIRWFDIYAVRRLLCSARPVVIQTPVNPTASDQDLQQAQLWQLAQRTTALPFGRGAFILATTCTLLTEALTVPKLILAGRLPSQQNATVNLDPNVRNVQELKSWPEFHNAVAAGLRLAPPQGKMSRTWILYNKPEEPTVVHAGLLLSLGLHGQLRVLTITDIYQYYSQEHESTTVGLMLGLAASYRGTMQPAISKCNPAKWGLWRKECMTLTLPWSIAPSHWKLDNWETGWWRDAVEIALSPWLRTGSAPRRSGIAGTLEIDNCHFHVWRGALLTEMALFHGCDLK
ncbi:hypothetical protein FXO37_02596 [Capsicum annuum]|nr:hypothetical protein FXO37_02596 [Capsicum annuum]